MEKFTKVRNVGKGNMGACALVRNNEDNKYYVIKQIDLTRMNKKERQQSLNEARLLSSLRHPNVINYVDSFLSRKSDHLCIVMEFADSGDLSTRIKKTYGVNFRETQVLDWVIQLTLCLSYIHNRKILHRDIKSQNVFLTNQNIVKLGDFGIARTLAGTYDQAKTFVGTPYYLSPELILERPYDHRSDIWALGVVIYELMSLKHPFNATSMKGLMQRILRVQYEPVPKLYSTELRNLIPRFLTKEPSHRIKLEELLELPIIQRRMREWMLTDVMPKSYIEALLSNDLLPPAIAALRKPDNANHNVPHHHLPLVPPGRSAPTNLPPVSHPVVNTSTSLEPLERHPQRPVRPMEGQQPAGLRPPVGVCNLAALRVPARAQPMYLMYKKLNGGYNSPAQPVVGRYNSRAAAPAPMPVGRHFDGPRPSHPAHGGVNATPGTDGPRPSLAPPRAHVDNIDAAVVSVGNSCGRPGPNAQAVGGAFGLPSMEANGVDGAGQNYMAHRGLKRHQQVSNGVASCINPFFQTPSGIAPPLPCFSGAPNTDIKAMLQRAALERAQRRAFS